MDQIQFHCIACGAGLTAAPAEAGGICTCGQCQRRTPIPVLGRLAAEILGIEIKFRAACCGAELQADAQSQGMVFDCPICQAASRVPFWGEAPAANEPNQPPPKAPAMRLTAEECAFLSAPLPSRKPAFASVGN